MPPPSARPPHISFVLPTRNRANLLGKALASMQRQTLRDIEILVLDDGSEDETPEVIQAAQHADGRVRAFQGKGEGAPAAMNRLIAEARATYVAVMHDDDVALPKRLEYQLAFVETHAVDVCGTWYRRIGRVSSSIARPPTQDDAIRSGLHFQPTLLHPSVFIRRRWLETVGGYSTDFRYAAEDYDLWTRLAVAGARFGNVPQVLMLYRQYAGQASRVFAGEQLSLAHEVRARYLAACGVPATAEQIALHIRVRDPEPLESLDELRAFETWLLTLRTYFAASPSAADMVARQWLFVGCRAAGLGMRCWRVWRASPLAAATAPKKAALLLALCAGRVRYRSPAYRLLEPFAPA